LAASNSKKRAEEPYPGGGGWILQYTINERRNNPSGRLKRGSLIDLTENKNIFGAKIKK